MATHSAQGVRSGPARAFVQVTRTRKSWKSHGHQQLQPTESGQKARDLGHTHQFDSMSLTCSYAAYQRTYKRSW